MIFCTRMNTNIRILVFILLQNSNAFIKVYLAQRSRRNVFMILKYIFINDVSVLNTYITINSAKKRWYPFFVNITSKKISLEEGSYFLEFLKPRENLVISFKTREDERKEFMYLRKNMTLPPFLSLENAFTHWRRKK